MNFQNTQLINKIDHNGNELNFNELTPNYNLKFLKASINKKVHSHSEPRRQNYNKSKRGNTTESMLNNTIDKCREKQFRHPRIYSNKLLDQKMKVFDTNLKNFKRDSKLPGSQFISENKSFRNEAFNKDNIKLRHIPQMKHPKIKIYPLVQSIARIDS
jgi:hypothetical protein